MGANAARGNSDGQGTLHNESLIQASNALVFSSGGDTLLQGAQLRGEQVVGRVGGNLTLRSEQDTDRYDSRQLALKGEATIGYGFDGSASGSASLIDSQYRSVREQTGIEAGSGGFQLHVDGHTALIGAAIASSADAASNQLTTGSLSVDALQNEARYLAASVSGGTSGGGSPGDMRFDAGAALGVPTGDSKGSTTRSGLADATVIVGNGDRSALEGLQRGVFSLDDGTGFRPIFDQKKVEERQALTNLLGQMGLEAAGDLAANRRAQAQAALASATATGNAQGIAEATAQLEAWSEGGRNKVLLHGLTGAAVAALSGGDVGKGALGAASAEVAKNAMLEYLQREGVDPRSAVFSTLMELGSAAVGGLLAGEAGAGSALMADRYNRQMHWDQYLQELEVCKANPARPGCSTILKMSENTTATVISAANGADYAVVANQNAETGETVSFTLTDADGTPRIIMERDEYNQFVVSGLPPFMYGMAPGYALDYGSSFMHMLKGDTGEGLSDLSRVFTSGEYWQDMAIGAAYGTAAHAMGRSTGLVRANPVPPTGGPQLGQSALVGRVSAGLVDDAAKQGARANGWRVGGDVYAPTATGKEPSWSTVRARFWKNEASKAEAGQKYSEANLLRMKRGLAPRRYNAEKGGLESMELSHEPIPQRDGGKAFVPRWPQEHALMDPYRRPGY